MDFLSKERACRIVLLAFVLVAMGPAVLGGGQQAGPGQSGVRKDPVEKGKSILERAIEASGGKKAFAAITNFTIKTESEITGLSKISLTVTETILLPDKTKQILALANGTRIQVLAGSQSWKQINSDVSALSNKEKREMERGLFRDLINLFKNYDGEEYRATHMGEETLAGHTNHVIEIRNAAGDFFTLYIDSETALVRRKSYLGAPEVGLVTMTETYSDYRKAESILMPFSIIVTVNGKPFTESRVIEAKLNTELSNTFFLRN